MPGSGWVRQQDCRIAVICVGFVGNPVGMQRLSRYLARIDAWLYVHIDARADISAYAAAAAQLGNVTLLDARVAVWWGGFSLIRAVVGALRQAMADADYTRFCLISEDSAPLADAALFRTQMLEPWEWIKMGMEDPAGEQPRYRRFYYLDSAATNPRSYSHDRIVDASVLDDLRRLELLRAAGKYVLARMFHGPGWWALTRRAIREVLLQYDTNVAMRESFEFSLIPEEQYFHTILGNAAEPFTCRPFMYADFGREPSPFVFTTLGELNGARSMPFLFIRKVHLGSPEVGQYFDTLEA